MGVLTHPVSRATGALRQPLQGGDSLWTPSRFGGILAQKEQASLNYC